MLKAISFGAWTAVCLIAVDVWPWMLQWWIINLTTHILAAWCYSSANVKECICRGGGVLAWTARAG